MSNALRRLCKLEAQLTDHSGLVPHSDAWFQHWAAQYDRFIATGDSSFIQGMTLDFIDEAVARFDRETSDEEIRETPSAAG